MKYLVMYVTSNGEHCHCHRQEFTNTEEYSSIKFLAEDMASKWKWHEKDFHIEEIYKVEDIDSDTRELIRDKLQEQKNKIIEEDLRKEEEDFEKEKTRKEKKEREEYLKLKEKYE